ncbi:MAG TPA: hypothetical protein VNW71_11470 [Thermoanaerobaculia bacterium]|nr:hypothetical protein [Thermoanaerobaculia bacterium]
MKKSEKLAALAVALHLSVVLLGALERLPLPRGKTGPLHLLAAYGEYTGASSDYSFFSPAVGSQVRVRLLRTDASGARQEIHLRTPNREVNFRIGSMLLSAMKISEIRTPMARSWAALVLRSSSEATKVDVVAEFYSLPSMAEHRSGRRGIWKEIYRGEFEAVAKTPVRP